MTALEIIAITVPIATVCVFIVLALQKYWLIRSKNKFEEERLTQLQVHELSFFDKRKDHEIALLDRKNGHEILMTTKKNENEAKPESKCTQEVKLADLNVHQTISLTEKAK